MLSVFFLRILVRKSPPSFVKALRFLRVFFRQFSGVYALCRCYFTVQRFGCFIPHVFVLFSVILSRNAVCQRTTSLKGFFPATFGSARALQMLVYSSAVWVFYCLCFRVIFRSFFPEMVFVKVLRLLRVFPTIFRSVRALQMLLYSSAVSVFYCLCFRTIFWSFSPEMAFVKVLFFLGFFPDKFWECMRSSVIILRFGGLGALLPMFSS